MVDIAPHTDEARDVDEPRIVLRGVTKRYGGVQALAEASLEVPAGEVHALLGENGAGKSTLMNIASGTTQADEGSIEIDGVHIEALNPARAAELGIAIVHQHPALLPDMTVAENLRVSVPKSILAENGDVKATMRLMLDDVGFMSHLEDRVASLSIVERHLLELAKALIVKPSILILDEPTAPLDQASVDMLFDRIRRVAASGSSVIYITHRLAEVRVIADRVTVLRDGRVRGVSVVDGITDDDLLSLIVGRKLESTFPPKLERHNMGDMSLAINSVSGADFSDISISAHRGEIVGIAGVVGNGQSQLLRALAGLENFSGSVQVGDVTLSPKNLRNQSAYLPPDRHSEGLMMSLSVRENASVSALDRFVRGLFVSRNVENEVVSRQLDSLNTKSAGLEAPVTSLSGGNQQKVVLARALLSEPSILVADEPTQGVDVGARAEIYGILRSVSAGGVPVVVASSDALELEGLCDRVLVMSRGESVAELVGEEVTEEAIIHAAMRAEGHKRAVADGGRRPSTAVSRFVRGDYAPVAVLALLMIALGSYIYTQNDRYISAFNTSSVMLLCAALGFISIGQTIALLLGGIDLSVGPLSGFLVVVGSFFIVDEKSAFIWTVGFVLMALCALAIGLGNGSLIRFLKFTPVAATLAMFIGLQGLSFVLRDSPGGIISRSVTDAITTKIERVPVAFVLFILTAVAMEYGLRRTAWGLRLRAVGSNEDSARKIGVGVTGTLLGGYMAVSFFVFLGAVILLAQLGIGDPAQGEGFTLDTITAVVLGGTTLLGGRGSFIGTIFGAGLIVQVINGATFLGFSQARELLFQGLLILAAAVVYSQIRGERSVG
ncbi:MAG: ATP-binding cassette domain-containing protein [Acidimicrobiia bacterium]|nr:ATP-binding cassette domain-containing protein [Acidimicrobiia bacterium]